MKHLILPVETAARELDAKLMLALAASRHGIATTLGAKALVNLQIQSLPRGVYLPPNLNRTSERIVGIARDLGHQIAGWDEEGLVWLNPGSYRGRRVSVAVLAKLDAVFAWGDEHAAALAPALAGLPLTVEVTGHPRADLLRPEFRHLYAGKAAALKAEFGDFILINSNFGWINYVLAEGSAAAESRNFAALAAKSNFPEAYLRHRAAIFDAFTAVLPEIARRFPDRRIVVRPHPDENHAGWRAASQGLSNVTVRYDSELVPWLLAAGHIVQNGCTTAIEAAMLDRTAISFRPHIDPPFEIPQPTAVGVDALTPEALMELLADAGVTDRRSAGRRQALEARVASIEGAPASERIAQALDGMFARGATAPRFSLARLLGQAAAFRRALKKRARRNDPTSTSNPAYYTHKFPPISVERLADKAGAFADHLAIEPPRVEEISDSVFRFSPR